MGRKPECIADDFVKYICGAGQKIVGETYVPVAKETSFLADPDAQGTLSIRGVFLYGRSAYGTGRCIYGSK